MRAASITTDIGMAIAGGSITTTTGIGTAITGTAIDIAIMIGRTGVEIVTTATSDNFGKRSKNPLVLKIAGTLSVLDEADQAGLVDFEHAVTRLGETSFRVPRAVLPEIQRKTFSLTVCNQK